MFNLSHNGFSIRFTVNDDRTLTIYNCPGLLEDFIKGDKQYQRLYDECGMEPFERMGTFMFGLFLTWIRDNR